MAKYLNEKANERTIHGQHGAAAPGEVVELDDREYKVLTEAGYKLTPVATRPPAKKADDSKASAKPDATKPST